MPNNTTTTLEVTAVNTEYLNTRLHDLGISDEQNIFTRVWNQTSSGVGDDGKIVTTTNEQKREYKIFEADEEGNIVIHYFNLMGQPYSWKKKDTKWPRDFVRTRLRVPRGDQKYNQEEGSGQYPFFTPGLISKYKQNKDSANIDATPVAPVDILFIVEGEFKAFKGYMAGLDIIGVLGIHGFYNGDVRGKLHDDVQDLIITCKVRKVVFLVDADLLTVKWEEKKDGSVRIDQTIYVERDSQKKIVLGHKGETIRAIGQAARMELSGILEQKVHLFLFVKVRENWGDDPERYREMGLEFPH